MAREGTQGLDEAKVEEKDVCDLLQDQVCLTEGKTQRNNSIVFSLSSIIEHY